MRASFEADGGGGEIGGSAYRVKVPSALDRNGYKTILVDCGMRHIELIPENYGVWGPNFAGMRACGEISACIITHAHADHCASAPILVRMFPNLHFYMTAATWDLACLQWGESIRRMSKFHDMERGTLFEGGAKPLFTEDDLLELKRRTHIIEMYGKVELGQDVSFRFIPAGHILGAISVLFSYVENGRQKIGFHTGDINHTPQLLVPGAPRKFKLANKKKIDWVSSESTYIGTPMEDREKETLRFVMWVKNVLRRGGRVCIPAFKIQKAQEVREILLKYGVAEEDIFVDGYADPVFSIYKKYTVITPLQKKQTVKDWSDRQELWEDKSPRVIIAFGGMIPKGSAAWHNMRLALEEKSDALAIVGYQDPCSPGGLLLEHIAEGKGEIVFKENEEPYRIDCEVAKFVLSAHDSGDDLEHTAGLAQERVIWTHGEARRINKHLEGKDSSQVLGENGKEVEL